MENQLINNISLLIEDFYDVDILLIKLDKKILRQLVFVPRLEVRGQAGALDKPLVTVVTIVPPLVGVKSLVVISGPFRSESFATIGADFRLLPSVDPVVFIQLIFAPTLVVTSRTEIFKLLRRDVLLVFVKHMTCHGER